MRTSQAGTLQQKAQKVCQQLNRGATAAQSISPKLRVKRLKVHGSSSRLKDFENVLTSAAEKHSHT